MVESIAREQRKRMDTHDRRRIGTERRKRQDDYVKGGGQKCSREGKEDSRWSDARAKERRRGANGERKRTNEGRKTNRQADSRVHRARVLLAIRALDETQSPLRSRRAAATSPALAHAGPADL